MKTSAYFTFLAVLLTWATRLQAASTIQFTATTYTVAENAGSVSLAVQRTEDTNTVVSVDYATADGSATNGLKYTAASGTLDFGAGETNKTLLVPILNEGFVEGTKWFRVVLTNAVGDAVLGARSAVTVSIADNDVGLQLEFGSHSVAEGAGSVLIGVVRGDDGSFPVSVDYFTTDSTAVNGLDYMGVTNTLLFAAGEKVHTFTIPILNDGLKESSKAFRVTLSNPTNQILGARKVATVTIVDNDAGVQFQPLNRYWIAENEGALTLTVVRGNDGNLGSFAVDFATSNLASGHNRDRLLRCRLRIGQGGDAFIQSRQGATAVEGQAQEIRVRHLLMPQQPHAGKGHRFGKGQVVRPEPVVLGRRVGHEDLDGLSRLHCVAGEGGVGHDANESRFRQGTRGPALGAMAGEPLQGRFVPLMGRPEQCDQEVGVEQITVHAPSASIRRTASVVTEGESAGNWNTTSPPLSWAGVGALKPRRTRSDTVLPSETRRSFAWRAAKARMSSSRDNVVLMAVRCLGLDMMSIGLPRITWPSWCHGIELSASRSRRSRRRLGRNPLPRGPPTGQGPGAGGLARPGLRREPGAGVDGSSEHRQGARPGCLASPCQAIPLA
jgi:hypothetical protein